MKRYLLMAVAAVMTLGALSWCGAPAVAHEFHPHPVRVVVRGHEAKRGRVVVRRDVHVRYAWHRGHRR